MAMDDSRDVTEWSDLGARLATMSPKKFDELLDAMRKIVEGQEVIASFDWQLLFGSRPNKRYQA